MRKIACYLFSAALLASAAACTKKEQDPDPVVTGVTVVAVTPGRGAAGTVVLLKGSNFSENPGANAVAFSGVAAQVTAATAHQLTTTVPAGARIGKVTVTVDGKTSTSQLDFIVEKAPVITAVSPLAGGPGTQVTLSGSDFSYVPEDNLVRFNGTIARVVANSLTQLSVLVPEGATAGKITVEANGYKGTSAAEYIVTNDWVRKADFPGIGRQWPATFTIGNKAYLGTGYNATANTSCKDFWEFDPASNAWTQKADFGGIGRYGASGFAIGNKGYMGTGFANILNLDGSSRQEMQKDFWEYSPASNTWTQKADFGGTARYQAAGLAIGNKGYIGTGSSNGMSYMKDFWEYDPASNQWTQKAEFAGTAQHSAASFSIGNKGYIALGWDANSSVSGNSYRNYVWEYDPQIDRWTKKADFPGSGRLLPAGFAVGTKGYIGTGFGGHNNSNKDVWEYTPQ